MPASGEQRRSRALHVVPDLPAPASAGTAGDEECPDPVSLRAGAHNLPWALSSFVGRRRDMEEVGALVASGRLVTITGPSGMGKTRLAIEVAARLPDSPQDGVWLVELALIGATENPDLVAEAVASVFDVVPQPRQSFSEALVDRLRNATTLVLLDNCEHLAGAVVSLAGDLLVRCPGVRILATSQRVLGLPGEQVWPLEPLSLPEPENTEETSDAVALFHARARSLNPRFTVTDQGAAAVAETCRRLDGIPLAIELAAARTVILSPVEIARMLDERFRLLTGGSHAAASRHRTLRAALDWSWDLLEPAERALLRRLSIFAGGAGLGEVRAVCTGGEVAREAVLDLLGALVSKSLVVADTSRSMARYRLLETVRDYGRDRIEEAGEMQATGARHARRYLQLAEQGWHRIVGASDEDGAGILEAEHDNLRSALTWFLGTGDPQSALRLCSALTPFWNAQGHFREGLDWLDRAMRGSGAPVAMTVRALWGVGMLSLMQGDLDRATSALEESLALARRHGYDRPAMEALNLLAFISVFTKNPLTAVPLLEESVAFARARDDGGSLITALALYGRARLFSGDTEAALAVFEECRELGRALGRGGETPGLVGLGWVALAQGRHAEATRLFSGLLPSVRRSGDRFQTALVLSFVGELAWRRGDHDEARRVLEESAALARAMGAPFPLARALLGLGRVAQTLGDNGMAGALVDEAVAAAQRARFPHAVVRCLVGRADLDGSTGDLEAAEARLKEALTIATDNGDRAGAGLVLRTLGTVARLGGDYQRCTSLYLEALDLAVVTGDVGGVADSLDALAALATGQDRAEHAARLFGAADSLRRACGALRPRANGFNRDTDPDAVRAAVDGADFDQAFAEGAALSLEDAVALAANSRGGPRRPATGWASLTATEVQVVDLVAEGLTNPEVASRMCVSPRTVQSHLVRIFRKVGIGSRRELREAVRQRSEG